MKRILRQVTLMIGCSIMLSGCCIYFTCEPPPAPCPIEDLLLTASDIPGTNWAPIKEPSVDSAPVRIGIERIGVGFYHDIPYDGAIQEIYRLLNQRAATRQYKEELRLWFSNHSYSSNWVEPEELSHFSLNADRHAIACNIFTLTDARNCKYLAQYDVYIIRFDVRQQGLEYDDFASSIKRIDEKMVNCLR